MHVADSHSFTAAADRLGMSKATVSKHVSKLEADLDVRLLTRTTRSVALTSSGAKFYGHCQQIMAELAAATAEIKRSDGVARERFRIAAVTAFGHLTWPMH
jgi:DNA-binding transcriptional LysR family regulator